MLTRHCYTQETIN